MCVVFVYNLPDFITMTTPKPKDACSVEGCRNSTRNPLLTFFRLPARPERRKDWLKLMGREDLISNKDWVQHRVCEIHFRPHHFQNAHTQIEKKLTRFALPTLFMPVEVSIEQGTDPCVPLAEASTSTTQESSVKKRDNSTQTVKYEEKDEIQAKALRFKVLCDRFLSKEMSERVKAQMLYSSEEYQPKCKKIKTEESVEIYEIVQDDFVKTETFFT